MVKFPRTHSRNVEIIIEKVGNHRDFVTSSAVCKLWHSVVTKNLHRLPYKLPLALCLPYYQHGYPLLFQASGTNAKPNYLYSLTGKKVFNVQFIPEIENKRIAGSSLGWFVTMEVSGMSMYLLNPLTRVQILLPSLSSFLNENLEIFEGWEPYRFISKVIITSDPVTSKNDCFVIAVAGTSLRLYYCRIGDESWSEILGYSPKTLQDVIVSDDWIQKSYTSLVDSSDGLLLVKHSCDNETPHNDRPRYEWEHLNSIGDMAMFLGYGYAKCLKASTHTGIKGNCIYFGDCYMRNWARYDMSKYSNDIRVFHLEGGHFEKIAALTNDDDSLQ